jgi:hypothetical protein
VVALRARRVDPLEAVRIGNVRHLQLEMRCGRPSARQGDERGGEYVVIAHGSYVGAPVVDRSAAADVLSGHHDVVAR